MSIQAAPADFELSKEGNLWVAVHAETRVASHGSDPNEAVRMAKEAVALHRQDHEVGDEAHQHELLREFGIDPDEVSEEIV